MQLAGGRMRTPRLDSIKLHHLEVDHAWSLSACRQTFHCQRKRKKKVRIYNWQYVTALSAQRYKFQSQKKNGKAEIYNCRSIIWMNEMQWKYLCTRNCSLLIAVGTPVQKTCSAFFPHTPEHSTVLSTTHPNVPIRMRIRGSQTHICPPFLQKE